MLKTTHKIEFYDDAQGEWRSRVRAANGRIILDGGEGYKRCRDARRALFRFLLSAKQDRVAWPTVPRVR